MTKTRNTLTSVCAGLQSLQDKRHLFFLVNKLPDKNTTSHLGLLIDITSFVSKNTALRAKKHKRLKEFMENEARSCSMDFGCVTPEYVYRMWGGSVAIDEIAAGLMEQRKNGFMVNGEGLMVKDLGN